MAEGGPAVRVGPRGEQLSPAVLTCFCSNIKTYVSLDARYIAKLNMQLKTENPLKLRHCYWAVLAIIGTPAVAETQMWVTVDTANRRTCPSTDCGVVGGLMYRESARVIETDNGWGRISRYYDASCADGYSQYVDAGPAACVQENGIVDGKFAEWVKLDLLSEARPADPGAGATGTAALVAQSDDFRHYEVEFVNAAEGLIASGDCTGADLTEVGGFLRSTNRGEGIYFTFCGGGSNRVYLDVASGRTFR